MGGSKRPRKSPLKQNNNQKKKKSRNARRLSNVSEPALSLPQTPPRPPTPTTAEEDPNEVALPSEVKRLIRFVNQLSAEIVDFRAQLKDMTKRMVAVEEKGEQQIAVPPSTQENRSTESLVLRFKTAAAQQKLNEVVDTWMLGIQPSGIVPARDEEGRCIAPFKTNLPFLYRLPLLVTEQEVLVPLRTDLCALLNINVDQQVEAAFEQVFKEKRRTIRKPLRTLRMEAVLENPQRKTREFTRSFCASRDSSETTK